MHCVKHKKFKISISTFISEVKKKFRVATLGRKKTEAPTYEEVSHYPPTGAPEYDALL